MYRITQWVYNTLLRKRLPRKLAVCNGVTTRRQYLLDATDKMPGYKESLCRAIAAAVESGDSVSLIGGGYGVSTVKAAEAGGCITSFEGSEELSGIINECVSINGVSEKVNVVHGIVGDALKIDGDKGDVSYIPVSELFPCDVLILDCEGAEKGILEKAVGRNVGKIVVETHTELGSPPNLVMEILEEEYVIESVLPDKHRGTVNEKDQVITAK